MKNYKKGISLLMLIILSINSILLSNVSAKAQSIISDDIIYYDGLAYKSTLDVNTGDLIIESLSNEHSNTYLILHEDGTADVSIQNESDTENYFLDIHEMNDDALNIDVYEYNNNNSLMAINYGINDYFDNTSMINNNDNTNINNNEGLVLVRTYSSYEDLEYDQYLGQTITGVFRIISLTTLLEVLIVLALTAIVVGITYYSIVNTIEIIKEKAQYAIDTKNYTPFYPAYLSGPQVFIDLYNPISYYTATTRMQNGANIYTFVSTSAQAVTAAAASALGLTSTVIGPEIDVNRRDNYIYFYHYHVNRQVPSHAFFGFPYTK